MRVLAFPLHIAADWIGHRFGHYFASEMIFERSLEFRATAEDADKTPLARLNPAGEIS